MQQVTKLLQFSGHCVHQGHLAIISDPARGFGVVASDFRLTPLHESEQPILTLAELHDHSVTFEERISSQRARRCTACRARNVRRHRDRDLPFRWSANGFRCLPLSSALQSPLSELKGTTCLKLGLGLIAHVPASRHDMSSSRNAVLPIRRCIIMHGPLRSHPISLGQYWRLLPLIL